MSYLNLFPQEKENIREIGAPLITNISPAEHGGHTQNWALVQDPQGLIYVANTEGILIYDGVNWHLMRPPGEPVVRSLAVDEKGRIYVGAQGDFGYLAADSIGQLKYISLKEFVPENRRDFADVWQTYADGELVYFRTRKYAFRWKPDKVEGAFISEGKLNLWEAEIRFSFGYLVENEFYLQDRGIGIKKLVGDSLLRIPDSEVFSDMTLNLLLPFSDAGRVLAASTSGASFFTYDGASFEPWPISPEAVRFITDNGNYLYKAIQLSDGNYAIGSLRAGLGILDKKGQMLRIVDERSGLRDNLISNLMQDREGGLWLSFGDGLARLDYPGPFSLYGRNVKLDMQVFEVIRHQGSLYLGTQYGVYRMKVNPASGSPEFEHLHAVDTDHSVWDFLSLPEEMLIAGLDGLFAWNDKESALLMDELTFYLYPSKHVPGLVFAGLKTGLIVMKKNGSEWLVSDRIKGLEGEIREIAEDASGALWLRTRDNYFRRFVFPADAFSAGNAAETGEKILQVKAPNVQSFPTGDGILLGMLRLGEVNDRICFGAESGFFRYDSTARKFIPDPRFGPLTSSTDSTAISQFINDTKGDLWIIEHDTDPATPAACRKLTRGKDDVYQEGTILPIRTRAAGDVTSIYPDPEQEGVVWLAGSNGLLRYDENVPKNYTTPYAALIRRVLVNGDSLLYGGARMDGSFSIQLGHAFNALRFEYAAPTFDNPAQTRYQVYLDGFDEIWSDWTQETQKDYTNIPPGTYRFRVRARNVYLHQSEEGSFAFTISPPWYETLWAYLLYTLSGLLLLALIVYTYNKWRTRQLETRNRRLEQTVREKTRESEQQAEELKQTNKQLIEMDQLKTRFFTNISHELRTPLTVISGMAEQILNDPDLWSEKGGNVIKRNSDNLLNLVNQILDLRKLESGKLKLQLVQGNVISYLNYIAESFHSLAANKDLQLHFLSDEKEVIMDYDPEKLLRIVSNLLSNAIKFTPEGEGGNVYLMIAMERWLVKQQTAEDPPQIVPGIAPAEPSSVSAHQKPADGGALVIQIKDSGIGISQEKLPHIFDRFYQIGETTVEKNEGTGIGLTLTRELVKLMDGSIEVKSEVGEGTAFKIILPIRNEAEWAQDDAEVVDTMTDIGAFSSVNAGGAFSIQRPTSTIQQSTLLIVDDNEDVIEYLVSCLGKDYQLAVARDGQEGIDKALEQTPDIIISDVMMPRKDGFELCQTLKTEVRTSHIPIILLTAKADVESRISGLEKGADAYLTKPFNKAELFVRLKKLLELRQKLQQRYASLEKLAPSSNQQWQQEDEFMYKVRQAIEENIDDEDFSVLHLCRAVGFSRTQLHNKITALTNRSTSQFIRSVRLHKAQELLQTTDLTVYQVAYEVGFRNAKHFSTAFSKEFGQSPKKIRNS